MRDQSGKMVLILVLTLLLLGATAYFFLPVFKNQEHSDQVFNYSPAPVVNTYEASNSAEEMKDYYSKALKISFKVPKDARVEEKNDLLVETKGGSISIRRDGTNFGNVRDFFKDLKEKNTWDVKYNEMQVGKYDVIIAIFPKTDYDPMEEKLYLLYVDNWIYYFSTTNESLYPILDQIVQSFEYKP